MSSRERAISRRNFIRQTGMSGIALTVGACMPAFGKTVAEMVTIASAGSRDIELVSWISIDTLGKVTLLSHRSEMGQGTYQAIPQMIAEELEVNLDQVSIGFAPAHPKKYGPQPQEGSFSVRGWNQQLLRIGATARTMLIEAAAGQWNVPVSECYAANGEVIHRPSGKKAGYGILVEAASKLAPPQDVPLKDRKSYKLIGKPLPRQDIPLKTNGSAVFGLDKKLPGMLYAVVERSPRYLGKVSSFDDSATRAIAGVTQVFKVQRAVFDNLHEGVAVVATTLWAALQGRKVLKVEWSDEGFEHPGTEQLFAGMHDAIAKLRAASHPGSKFETAYQGTGKKLEAVYEAPYQSHSCMEPLNCIAHVQDNSIEIWGPIQEANWIQADLGQRMGIAAENIAVHMTFLGGGFGRKAFPDYPHEAALISKTIKAPVQVVWTREDDMSQGPYRPGAVYACKGGLDENGKLLALQAIMSAQVFWQGEGAIDPDAGNEGGPDGLPKPWLQSVPYHSFPFAYLKSPIPVMWWRSVYASTNSFALECFIDELAHAAGKDPLDFRRSHLADARYQALIDKLDALSGWKQRGKNAGWGVAITECFGSIVGQVVKVSRPAGGKLRIDNVIALMDCGWYVNPDTIRAQVEGSIVMALGAATKHGTHFTDGKAVERNFDVYKMPRMSDIPVIDVHIMENGEKAGGVGEPGLPAFAPALCNAIFDLTGKRVRKLPFDLSTI